MSFEEYRRRVFLGIEEGLARVVQGQEMEATYAYALAGGKRVRPTLTLLVAEALGAEPSVAMDLACSVELTHSASLVLDDIIDGHDRRRGAPALHSARGLKTAITTGFTLPSLALHLAARHSRRAAELLTETWVQMCLGVIREDAADHPPLEEGYLAIVDAKTSRLFSTGAAFGALAAGRSDLVVILSQWGRHLGRGFQMADDLVDGRGPGTLPPTLADQALKVLAFARQRLPKEVAAAEALTQGLEDLRPLGCVAREIVLTKEGEGP